MISDLVIKQKFFTKEECDLLKAHAETQEYKRGTWQKGNMVPEVDLLRRVVLETDIARNDEAVAHLIKRVDQAVFDYNEHFFHLDVNFDDDKHNPVKIIKMLGEEKAFVGNHQNVHWLSMKPHGKIYVSILLSDNTEYEGGELILKDHASPQGTPREKREQGRLIAYPAFRWSETTAVLTGTRYTMTFLYTGPNWQ